MEQTIINVYTEMTPNPETMKFVADKMLLQGQSVDFQTEQDAEGAPLASDLFGFPFVKGVFIANNFVTVTKDAETEWYEVIPTLREFIHEYLKSGKELVTESALKKQEQQAQNYEEAQDDPEIVEKIKEVLNSYVKPAVEMDGGAIKFKSFERGTLSLILQGACSGCPSSMVTLKAGIEGMMKRMVPQVEKVEAEEG